jgi:hypothetical protein
MKKFLNKIFLFFIPFGLYLLLVFVIDPYNYIKNNNFIKDDIKAEISYKIHYPLWKLNNFERNPSANILLGDSRTDAISTTSLSKETGEKYANLAYGGGSLEEIVVTFWLATKYTSLKKVYIGLNFNLYNKYNKNNRVEEAVSLNKNFFSYALNRYTFKASFYILSAQLFNTSFNLEKPKMSKDEFWDYQLDFSVKSFYQQYAYPDNYYLNLKKITLYCQVNNIQLIFFIPPTHTDLQKKTEEFSLVEEEKKFISDLNSLGLVYDFNTPSKLTRSKDNFKDPFHLKEEYLNDIFKGIVKKEN